MAQDPGKTEKATPKRRQKAREEGSVPRSADFDGAILLWGNFFLFLGLGGATLALMAKQVAHFLELARPGILADAGRVTLLGDVYMILGRLLLPFLLVNLLVALITGFAQRGFTVTAKPLLPKFEKLDPAKGFQRPFSSGGPAQEPGQVRPSGLGGLCGAGAANSGPSGNAQAAPRTVPEPLPDHRLRALPQCDAGHAGPGRG